MIAQRQYESMTQGQMLYAIVMGLNPLFVMTQRQFESMTTAQQLYQLYLAALAGGGGGFDPTAPGPIGGTTPGPITATTLDVQGDASLAGALNDFLGSPGTSGQVLSSLGIGGVSWTGDPQFNTVKVGNGSVAAPSYAFVNDTDCGLYRIGANTLGMSIGGVLLVQYAAVEATFIGNIKADGASAGVQVNARNLAAGFSWYADTPSDLKLYSFLAGANAITISSTGTITVGVGALTVGYLGIPQNVQSIDYTLVLADNGKEIYETGATKTITIPANGSVAFPIGAAVTFVSANATGTSIAITTDTLTLAGTTTTGTRTLAQNGIATAVKQTATSWLISGTGLT